MKKKLSLLLGIVMLLSPLVGCNSGQSPSTASTAANGGTPTTSGGIATTAAAGSTPRKDLVVGTTQKLANPMNPFSRIIDNNFMIYDTLFRFDYNTFELKPWLAESYTPSNDGSKWTVKLREDVYFVDGENMTSADVVYSMELAMTGLLAYSFLPDASAAAVDTYTVEFDFTAFDVATPANVASLPVISSKSHKNLGADGFETSDLMGSGPMKLQNYDSATGLTTLAINDTHWGTPSNFETITIRHIPDPSTILIALEKGEIDFASLDPSAIATAKNSPNLELFYAQPFLFNFLFFNVTVPPFNQKEFRQAIGYALDRESIAMVADYKDNYIIESAYYSETYGPRPDGLRAYDYNPDAARELLAGLNLTLPIDLGSISIMGEQKVLAEMVQQNLADVGITIHLDMVEQSIYLEKIFNGDYTMGLFTRMDFISSARACIYQNFHSSGIELMLNLNFYANDELDGYLDIVNSNTDDYYPAMQDAMIHVTEEGLYAIMYINGRVYAHQKGLNIDTMNYHDRYFYTFYWK